MGEDKVDSGQEGLGGRKMSRRAFIELGGLAGAGLAVSCTMQPPAGEVETIERESVGFRLEEKWVATSCSNCPASCPMLVRVVNGKAVKVTGNPLSKFADGKLCPRAHLGVQVLYDPDRLPSPMRRTNPTKARGADPKWVPITWDEALQELTARLRTMRQAGEPHKLLLLHGHSPDSDTVIAQRFAAAFGTPNIISSAGLESEADKAGQWMADGNYDLSACDLGKTNYLVAFGASLIEAGLPAARLQRMWGMMRRERPIRGKVVVVDPRLSITASKADEWIPIKPGTDAALAMGLANVIITEDLYDKDFIARWTAGFDEYRDLVLADYSPDEVSAITGISPEVITRLAREFANTKPAIAWRGKEATAWPNGSYTSYAIFCLNALVGSIDVPGGILYQESVPFKDIPPIVEDEIARQGRGMPRLDLAGTTVYPRAAVVTNQVADSVLKDEPYPVEIALAWNCNFNMSAPRDQAWDQALAKIPYFVYMSPFDTEMAQFADIVLPLPTFLEKWACDQVPPGAGFAEATITQPVVELEHDTRALVDVLFDIAQSLGGSVAQSFAGIGDGAEDFVRYRTQTLGLWADLFGQGVWTGPDYRHGRYSEIFDTPSRKFEFYSGNLKALFGKLSVAEADMERMNIKARGDLVFLPHYEEPGFQGDAASYPLSLVSYKPALCLEGGSQNAPWAQQIYLVMHGVGWTNLVEISSHTAASHRISSGDMVWLESPFARIKAKAKVNEGLHPGVVAMAAGQGHWAYGRWAKDIGANPNDITGVDYDHISGAAAFYNTRVKVYKA